MDWIKRNLYFVIGGVAALVLMGLAGWFLYSKWSLNNENLGKLNADYTELGRLNGQKPHPGSGQVNNIQAAKEQQQQLRALIQNCRKHFQRIAPIPDIPKVTDRDFSGALSRTIDQLQKDATNASVVLPANYKFSFEVQNSKVQFAIGSLGPLSEQLGEVKEIAQILFQAKINSLDAIRRERVCSDDNAGPLTDYLGEKSVTNDLAVITPYEVTFRCFSAELASVLAGFGSSPYGFIIKTINVEPGPAVAAVDMTGAAPFTYAQPTAVQPTVVPVSPTINAAEAGENAAFMRRYGVGPAGGGGGRYGGEGRYGGGGGNLGGVQLRGFPTPTPTPAYAPAQPGVAPAPATRGGLPTVLDEKQLKVTMAVYLVKLLPGK